MHIAYIKLLVGLLVTAAGVQRERRRMQANINNLYPQTFSNIYSIIHKPNLICAAILKITRRMFKSVKRFLTIFGGA